MFRHRLLIALCLIAAGACSAADTATGAQKGSGEDSGRRETAIFAGGCFWSVESNFEHMSGVVAAVSGFTGGTTANPTYDQVVRGRTGHVEAVQVTYDPARISYRQLVDQFWRTIDPTDPSGQFCDRGPSYRTAVFVSSAQKPVAEASRQSAAARLAPARFVTPIRDAARFWAAEPYHQDFARRNPVRYAGYARFCGRSDRLNAVWGGTGV